MIIIIFIITGFIIFTPNTPFESSKNKTIKRSIAQKLFEKIFDSKNEIDRILEEGQEPNKLQKEKLYSRLKELEAEKKKNSGVSGDVSPADMSYKIIGDNIDLEKKKYVSINFNIKDVSGIYRIRLLIIKNKRAIGYMQINPNSKKKSIDEVFVLDNRVILDNLMTLKNYEGADITLLARIWDNNMNMREINLSKKIHINDNIPPEKIKAYWTYFFDADNEVEAYNKETKNKFSIYKINDIPFIPENKISRYEYGYEDINGKLLMKTKLEELKEKRQDVEVDTMEEGKFVFFVRAYDLNNNFSEKKIKFFVDKTPPTCSIIMLNGIEINSGDEFDVKIDGTDNLSGIFRYRIADTENKVWSSQWKDYKEGLVETMTAPVNEGVYDIWVQMEDNAFNISKPQNISYYSKPSNTSKIKAKGASKEATLELDKEKLLKGKVEIKNYKEK